MRKDFKDEVKNPLLENAKIKDANQSSAKEIKEIENRILTDYNAPNFKTKLHIAGAGQLLRYTESGLRKLEFKIQKLDPIENMDNILDTVRQLFFQGFIETKDFNPEYNVKRLENEKTVDYYNMFLSDLKRMTFKGRVEKTVRYWKTQYEADKSYQIYIGGSFGEVAFQSPNYPNAQNKVYVNINDHINDNSYLHNLAILKLQIDEDYLTHEISLLINTLLKFEIITMAQHDEFMYGSNVESDLKILKLGISKSTFNKLRDDKQLENIGSDKYGNLRANGEFRKYIACQKGLFKFELEQYF